MRYLKHGCCMAVGSYVTLAYPQAFYAVLAAIILIYSKLAQAIAQFVPYHASTDIIIIKALAALATTLVISTPLILLCMYWWRQRYHTYSIIIMWTIWLLQIAILIYAKPIAVAIS